MPPQNTEDNKLPELFKIAELAVQHSGDRLRLAFNEEDNTGDFNNEAAHFLKLDGKRLGRDIELYGLMGKVTGWEQTLAIFLEEILLFLKHDLPESYAVAGEALRILGHSVYPEEILTNWNNLF